MLKRAWHNLGPVAGLLALFIAMGGPAWAAQKINGKNIKAETVTSKQIRNGSVTGADIADRSVGTADLAPSLVAPSARTATRAKAADTATKAKAADSATTALRLPGVLPGAVLATDPAGTAGQFSLAAGRRASAPHTGSFVWADSTNATFSSTLDNQFAIRAANGLFTANDAGGAKSVPVGTRYRDNAIVAWARVTAAGGLDTNFNVASVARVSAGQYRITLNSSLSSGFSLVPVVTVETDPVAPDTPPTGAANVRLVATNQVAAGNTFDVYIYNGSFALVDNDFQVMVTGR